MHSSSACKYALVQNYCWSDSWECQRSRVVAHRNSLNTKETSGPLSFSASVNCRTLGGCVEAATMKKRTYFLHFTVTSTCCSFAILLHQPHTSYCDREVTDLITLLYVAVSILVLLYWKDIKCLRKLQVASWSLLDSFVRWLPLHIDVFSCPKRVQAAQYVVAWNLHVTHWNREEKVLLHINASSTSHKQEGPWGGKNMHWH